MKKRFWGAMPAIAFILAVVTGSVSLFAMPQEQWSEAERRPLASAPVISSANIMDGRFFDDLDMWLADHFTAREYFRHLRLLYQTGVLKENEYNGFVREGDSIISLQKKVNEASVEYATGRFKAVWEKYLESAGGSVYGVLIPDKSAYLSGKGYPVLDFDLMEGMYSENMPYADIIGIEELLDLQDYYLTDSHWRQENLIPVAKYILEKMGRDASALDDESISKMLVYPFLGVYAGQSAMDPDPETLYYLTGGFLDGLKAIDMENKAPTAIADPINCDERDLYTMFLGGGKGLIRIDNPNGPEGELILFRDSFGSSMAPLLAAGYSRVYVVDLRYVHPDVLGRYIRFTGQDVLFMFSEILMNNSQGIR